MDGTLPSRAAFGLSRAAIGARSKGLGAFACRDGRPAASTSKAGGGSVKKIGICLAAAVLSAASLSVATAETPAGVQPIYSGQHGAWQIACSRVQADQQVFCNLAQDQPYVGKGEAKLILGVQLRHEGEYVFLYLPAGFKKDSNVTFVTDKKEAGEMKVPVEGRVLRILPELSKTHIKQFMAGNVLAVEFVPTGEDEKKFVRFNLAGFTASMNDARGQLKAAGAQ
jgi:invasion protein IalB